MSDNERECSQCHLKFSEFKATGLLGCPACYGEFQEDIEKVLAGQSGRALHAGKRYAAKIEDAAGDADVKQLTEELTDAVKREAFELAAQIRDKLRKQSETGSRPR
jgi:protein arginine kinase activator